MEAAGTAMYPLHRCKTVYLVRHAQGIHNVEGQKDPSAYMSPTLFDAQLTPLGWKQLDGWWSKRDGAACVEGKGIWQLKGQALHLEHCGTMTPFRAITHGLDINRGNT
ncbi:hypothetical protein EJB05_46858 [Eragrostis curvula]|uniref:Phosphoglycerate mutase-like protein n=1 Tax=Eragrostis curvula TaxID=38414 RepID=A0A5J9T5Z7_9POAL|nr:hypothetical protein EJB05_46858 [Eragrostis curvula]